MAPFLGVTGLDFVPNSFQTISREITMFGAAKQMASWRLHGSCSLSPTLAGLCTQAALIKEGFSFQTGIFYGAGEARKLFFHQPQGDRHVSEPSIYDEGIYITMPSCHRREEATVTDNFLGMPSDCFVTARCANLGIGLTSSHVKVSFDVGCCEFVFISRGYTEYMT